MEDYAKTEYNVQIAKRIFLNELEECRYFPKYLTIETCNSCNARCIMCPRGQKEMTHLELMEEELFDKILKELKGYVSWIEMVCLNSDGEPLLDKNIAIKIKKLKEIGIKHVNLSTNGQLLTKEMAAALMDSGLDDIRISLDALYKETYEKIRRGLNFEKVVQNVESFIQMRDEAGSNMEIRLRLVEIEENKEESLTWKQHWEQKIRQGDKAQIMPAHSWSGEVNEESEQKIQYYADKPCVSVFSSMAINYDGRVQLCDSDINQRYMMGDIHTSSIAEIWRGALCEKMRMLHASARRNEITICKGCDHWSRQFL